MLIPEPKNEPIVGVIDTQFDKSVYFSEWVEYHKCISEDIDLQTGDFFHALDETAGEQIAVRIKRLWMRKNSLKSCRNILQMY